MFYFLFYSSARSEISIKNTNENNDSKSKIWITLGYAHYWMTYEAERSSINPVLSTFHKPFGSKHTLFNSHVVVFSSNYEQVTESFW